MKDKIKVGNYVIDKGTFHSKQYKGEIGKIIKINEDDLVYVDWKREGNRCCEMTDGEQHIISYTKRTLILDFKVISKDEMMVEEI